MGGTSSRIATSDSIIEPEKYVFSKDEFKTFIDTVIIETKRRERLNYKYMKTDVCPICLDNYKDLDKMMLTKCYHHFHKECINEYKGFNCPSCRQNLN